MATSKPRKKLEVYGKKRNFAATPEPSGAAGASRPARDKAGKKSPKLPIFVVQKHHATAMHYDFRLEVDGVLKSWAVPKGPSTDPADKRLAVEVEDHPLDYANFEGVIPAGQYGGGTVIVWDRGVYHNIKADEDGRLLPMTQALRRGRVEIWLEGKKLRGGFALVRTTMAGKKQNWLLMKMKDAGAEPRDILAAQPRSVQSGRTLEQIAQEGGDPRYARRVRHPLSAGKGKAAT